MKLVIKGPVLQLVDSIAKLSAKIVYGENTWDLFYEIDREYADVLTTERADSFLISVLPLAMMKARQDQNLEIVCEAPISLKLYHQLVNYYIPILCKNISYYQPIRITADTTAQPLSSRECVGTGISGGVDSSYTIAKYMQPRNGTYRLTHGVFFNIGIYGGYDSDSEKMLEAKAVEIAKETDITYLCVKSNVCKELYGKAHAPIVPFVFMGAVLSMQKLFSVYYYSSGFSAEESHFAEEDAAYFDWLNVSCFSTENTQFYSSGLEATRLEKVKFISKYPFTYRNLSVCLTEDQHAGNCGRCAKCTRTMAELQCADALDRYKEVFDLSDFYENPGYHWGYIILKAWGGDHFCSEILKEYKRSGRKLPIKAYLGALQKWVKRGFTTANKKREKVENGK